MRIAAFDAAGSVRSRAMAEALHRRHKALARCPAQVDRWPTLRPRLTVAW